MKTRWNSVEDDRGIRHKVCSIRDAVKSSGLDRFVFVGRDDSGRFWYSFFLGGVLFSVGMQIWFIVLGLADLDMLFTPLWLADTAFSFVLYGVPMGLFIKLIGWRSVEHAKRAVLSIGLCPACAYQIYDVSAESDGCTVCPECSGAWRLQEDITASTPLDGE